MIRTTVSGGWSLFKKHRSRKDVVSAVGNCYRLLLHPPDFNGQNGMGDGQDPNKNRHFRLETVLHYKNNHYECNHGFPDIRVLIFGNTLFFIGRCSVYNARTGRKIEQATS